MGSGCCAAGRMHGALLCCPQRTCRRGEDTAGGGGGEGYTDQGARQQWGVVEGLGVNFYEGVLRGLLIGAKTCIYWVHGS